MVNRPARMGLVWGSQHRICGRHMGNLRDGEVDNGGVFLHKEVVLGEALDAEYQVGGQFGQLEFLEEILFVCFVLLQERETHRPCV